MAPLPVANSDRSTFWAPRAMLLAASGEPSVSISFRWTVHQALIVSAEMPSLLPS
jgi:hypothetical protein